MKEYIGTPSEIRRDFRKDCIKKSVFGLLVTPAAPIYMADMVSVNNVLRGRDEDHIYRLEYNGLSVNLYDREAELNNMNINFVKPNKIGF